MPLTLATVLRWRDVTMAEAGWYHDPVKRGEHRYFNGARWTDQIATLGVQSTDANRDLGRAGPPSGVPLVAGAKAAAGWYHDPVRRGDHRYFDGTRWTDQIATLGIQNTDPNRDFGLAGAPSGEPLVAARSQFISDTRPTRRDRDRRVVNACIGRGPSASPPTGGPSGDSDLIEHRVGFVGATHADQTVPMSARVVRPVEPAASEEPKAARRQPPPARPSDRNERRMLERQAASRRKNWYLMECAAMYWMRKNGFPEAKLGNDPEILKELGLSRFASADGGIDIWTPTAVAQVKAQAVPVGLADVQRHFGIATATTRRGLFFSTSGYTAAAAKFAKDRLTLYVIEVAVASSPSEQIPVWVRLSGSSARVGDLIR
jgi:Protein of unknown function (DUF2510)/Restriction endonuclease